MFGDDLRQRRLQPLAVRGDAERSGDGAGRIDADDGGFAAGIDRHARRHRDARADAGEFRVTRHADADPAAGGACRLLFGAQRIVADRGAGGVQAFRKARLVPDNAGRRFVGQLVPADEIAQPDFPRVDTYFYRRHVHQPFHDEGRDRPADAAIGPHRRFRCRHRLDPAAIILDAVGPGKKADHLHRLEPRRPRIDRKSADIADDVHPQRRDPALAVERQFGGRRFHQNPGCWRPDLPGDPTSI